MHNEEGIKEKSEKLSASATVKFKNVTRDCRSHRIRPAAGMCQSKEKVLLTLQQRSSGSQHVLGWTQSDSHRSTVGHSQPYYKEKHSSSRQGTER